jgi:putative ABC transport system permease protein
MSMFDPSQDARQTITPTIDVVKQLPTFGSDPTVLITPYGMQTFGLAAMPEGWLFHAPSALTSAQIDAARRAAASTGLVIETRSAPKSFAPLRNWSTVAGILVALGVLAMTVGLIRSEAGRDLSTLTATGASSWTRRTITGATTGALALLGALLGTAGAYAALIAWHRSDLHPLTRVPWTNLAFIIVALPAVGTATGWLLAGREPPMMSRQPLE